MKRVCVLSGGNVKGGYQAGALLKLEEMGITFEAIHGTSVGAVNAMGWGYGLATHLINVWHSIKKTSDILDFEFWNTLSRLMPTYNLGPLRKKLIDYAGGKDPKCEVVISYVDLRNGSLNYASTKSKTTGEMIECTIASASEPPLVKALSGVYLDGGLRDQTPLKRAIDDGADQIFAILTSPYTKDMKAWKSGFPRGWSELVRTVDIMTNEMFFNDIDRCLAYNQIPGKKKIDLRFIYPNEDFPSQFKVDPEAIQRAIDLGYKDADKLLNPIT